ncbi:MAG: patatin-like phospholipase family protein [Lachnospiraceae bacterium]|nr:patatin-like phospholipase family protein [Lachnospiraceae bacterium]
MKSVKRAIVLSGGGTKGAYELGVWRALRELSVDYHIVTGTSIGSVNGALMSMGNFEHADRVWREMVMGDLMGDPPAKKNPALEFLETFFLPPSHRSKRLIKGAVDNTPFLSFVEKNVDVDQLMDSDVDYGLVTVRARDRKPFLLTKKDMRKDQIKDFIIASSSVYPVFPMHRIDNEYFIDGMYYDNLPVELALSMGATELIIVDLHLTPQHPEYAGRSNVIYLTPSRDLGGILAFDRAKIDENIEMGYEDTIHKFLVGRI